MPTKLYVPTRDQGSLYETNFLATLVTGTNKLKQRASYKLAGKQRANYKDYI